MIQGMLMVQKKLIVFWKINYFTKKPSSFQGVSKGYSRCTSSRKEIKVLKNLQPQRNNRGQTILRQDFKSHILIKQIILTEMKIILELNQYVKQICEKIIHPLLRDNDCKNQNMNTTSWQFNIANSPPNKEEWSGLAEWKIEETNPRQTIPVNGKLKIHDNNIYLQVYMKYLKLREITEADIDMAKWMNNKYKDQDLDQPLLSAIEGPDEEQYYSCTLHLGPFSKDKLTNRSKMATLNFGVNLQDMKCEFGFGNYRLYKTFRGNLTYMEENYYKSSVKVLTGRNREVKLHGQSKEGRDQDPRQWFNDHEEDERKLNQVRIQEERKRKEEEKKEENRKIKDKGSYYKGTWDTQKESHYEDPDHYDKLYLGARSKICSKLSLSQKEDYRKEMNKEMYKKHEEMEYKQPIEPYEERQIYQED